ncbi:geranylgeranyl reductase family protein [Corynebacterium kutscheri]|uniref:FAD-linked oxidoreductase n=1 Tax=Corynebacterium kutscheri TaxID=35755 RepID=A0A0F6R0L5_9CORY|nr:geranylgeranyl reductase family protein [Corynebacterium kutscheri]AKE40508.1 geranylgeranyl reductase family protein [Corynebacterium kutscheri]VEH05063.1 FAD-linked oxidoreductase [Corynebacterium kutscheri]VEH10903.1 FAD-linked oxidoreductase [Corynebacterium kutscheri]
MPSNNSSLVHHADIVIIGGGPAGSAAAIHAARRGFHTIIVEQSPFPRDKTCGDGLTPRAIYQLQLLNIATEITKRYSSQGLKLHGFGGSVTVPWPNSVFGQVGSAMPRIEFDQLLHATANAYEETNTIFGTALRAHMGHDHRINSIELSDGKLIKTRFVVVADGVRSTFGKTLGRKWHKEEVYGIAARSYCATAYSNEPWIHSHLELRDNNGNVQPGYGWVFPLGNGHANVGCGALSTDRRPAKINTKKLLHFYADKLHEEWEFSTPEKVTSALLPMGGAVSGVSGKNWVLIGDAAACVNPLNGEGIDYGLETAAKAIELFDDHVDLTNLWPLVLRENYGNAFSLARTLARALTYPQLLPALGPLGLRGRLGQKAMPIAARLMGNLISDEDHDFVARLWRGAGSATRRFSNTPLWS